MHLRQHRPLCHLLRSLRRLPQRIGQHRQHRRHHKHHRRYHVGLSRLCQHPLQAVGRCTIGCCDSATAPPQQHRQSSQQPYSGQRRPLCLLPVSSTVSCAGHCAADRATSRHHPLRRRRRHWPHRQLRQRPCYQLRYQLHRHRGVSCVACLLCRPRHQPCYQPHRLLSRQLLRRLRRRSCCQLHFRSCCQPHCHPCRQLHRRPRCRSGRVSLAVSHAASCTVNRVVSCVARLLCRLRRQPRC